VRLEGKVNSIRKPLKEAAEKVADVISCTLSHDWLFLSGRHG
jgi:hypothetical protein